MNANTSWADVIEYRLNESMIAKPKENSVYIKMGILDIIRRIPLQRLLILLKRESPLNFFIPNPSFLPLQEYQTLDIVIVWISTNKYKLIFGLDQ
jgi:hypothetical protein